MVRSFGRIQVMHLHSHGALNLGSGISTTALMIGGVLIFGLFAFMGKR